MKKTSINLLCILIISILGFSIIVPAFMLGKFFVAGFKDGYENAMTGAQYEPDYLESVDVAFNPDINTIIHGNDSITMKNGDEFPYMITRASVLIPPQKVDSSVSWIPLTLYILCFVLFILFVVQFIKFIMNINKGKFFDEKNVKRLKRFSCYLISIALLKCVAGFTEDRMFDNLGFEIEGYSLSSYWEFPWATLLFGSPFLLMAQVWSSAIMMKKENDLTI